MGWSQVPTVSSVDVFLFFSAFVMSLLFIDRIVVCLANVLLRFIGAEILDGREGVCIARDRLLLDCGGGVKGT